MISAAVVFPSAAQIEHLILKAALDGCGGRQSGVTNTLVPRDRTQLATCPGRLRKNVKASSADIVLLGTPSSGPSVNTLM